MEFSDEMPSYEEVNRMDIVDYLATQGYLPVRDRNGKARFHSPIRDGDSDPSFIVYRRTNTWWDWGLGKGFTLIDLGMLLHHCTADEFRRKFADPLQKPISKAKLNKDEVESKLKILAVNPITAYALTQYILSRRIPLDIARQQCIQADFEIFKKQFAVGFRNDSGGYELRNSYFKGSSLPKDSTFINNGSSIVDVTEGFFSYLSDLTMYIHQGNPLPNFLVLNGTGFFERKIPLMREHDLVRLLLDHGKGGRKFTAMGLSVDRRKFTDGSGFFNKHDDLNDWWKADGYKLFRRPASGGDPDRNQGYRR